MSDARISSFWKVAPPESHVAFGERFFHLIQLVRRNFPQRHLPVLSFMIKYGVIEGIY